MDRVKFITLMVGAAMVINGYRLLAVPADLSPERVIWLAKTGVLLVVAGGMVLLAGLLRRP